MFYPSTDGGSSIPRSRKAGKSAAKQNHGILHRPALHATRTRPAPNCSSTCLPTSPCCHQPGVEAMCLVATSHAARSSDALGHTAAVWAHGSLFIANPEVVWGMHLTPVDLLDSGLPASVCDMHSSPSQSQAAAHVPTSSHKVHTMLISTKDSSALTMGQTDTWLGAGWVPRPPRRAEEFNFDVLNENIFN